jgi:hypothetical protein
MQLQGLANPKVPVLLKMAASRGHRVPPAMEEMLGHRSLIRSAIQ